MSYTFIKVIYVYKEKIRPKSEPWGILAIIFMVFKNNFFTNILFLVAEI